MDRKINVFICGMGKLGKIISKYAINKNCNIVGIYDKNIKKIEFEEKYLDETIKIEKVKDLKKFLIKTKTDICIVALSYLLEQDKEIYVACLKAGIDVITACEEAFYSINSNFNLTNMLHKLSKQNNCTIVGSGYQDIYWGQIVSSMTATINHVKNIKEKSIYNIDFCNKNVNDDHGVGLSVEEYEKKINLNEEFIPSFMWNVNGWICSKLGLNIINSKQYRKPIKARKQIFSNGLNKYIEKGQVIGTETIVEIQTEEGIKLKCSNIGKIFEKNDEPITYWEVEGEPCVKLSIQTDQAFELTASTIVNRIPDVINAQPGFITTDKLDELIYRKNYLEHYIK